MVASYNIIILHYKDERGHMSPIRNWPVKNIALTCVNLCPDFIKAGVSELWFSLL